MTSLPDWLVERAALDEVTAAQRERLDRADPRELAEQIAAVRDDNARELAGYPVGPAIAQITNRVSAATRARTQRQIVWRTVLGVAASAAAVLLVMRVTGVPSSSSGSAALDAAVHASPSDDDGTRVKGKPRLMAFRAAGDHAEPLAADALVHAGDVIQLRYNGGGRHYGVIASLDGAGEVTLHFPASEDAPADATALATETVSLSHAYALDDAPRFERFFFLTSTAPIDVHQSLDALRAFAHRDDSMDGVPDLPDDVHQWSLRLRKPDAPSSPPEPSRGSP